MNGCGRGLIVENGRGQTSVEYILLVAVVVIVLFSVFSIVKERVLAGAENCVPGQKSLVCQFHRIFSDSEFRYFRLVR